MFPIHDLLGTIGEIAATFVGFSLVVGLFRPADPSGWIRFYSVRDVAQTGLIATGASFLPFAIQAYGWTSTATWRAASAALLVAWVAGAASGIRRRLRTQHVGEQLRGRRVPAVLGAGMATAGVILLGYNVAVPGPSSAARYVTAVLLILGVASITFMLATFEEPLDPNAV